MAIISSKKEHKIFLKNLFFFYKKKKKKKKKKKDKNGGETIKNISYILQVLDSIRFIASSLTNLVNNLSVGIQTKKCLSLWIMDDWENFNETALPEKQDFYSH